MKHFYLYILLLCFIIIAVSTFTHYYKYYVLREPFGNSNNKNVKTYILLGDSIIKNNSYVKNGKAIEDILNEKNEEPKVMSSRSSRSEGKVVPLLPPSEKFQF